MLGEKLTDDNFRRSSLLIGEGPFSVRVQVLRVRLIIYLGKKGVSGAQPCLYERHKDLDSLTGLLVWRLF